MSHVTQSPLKEGSMTLVVLQRQFECIHLGEAYVFAQAYGRSCLTVAVQQSLSLQCSVSADALLGMVYSKEA